MELQRNNLPIVAVLLVACHVAAAMMVKGKQMTMDEAIVKAGSDKGMTKMYELMQDKDTAMVELDMKYKIGTYMAMRDAMTMETGNRKKRKAIIPEQSYRWPRARVPYEISYEFYASERSLIQEAISDYNRFTCIRFVPASSSDRNRVRFQNGEGCSSYVGMIGGTQPISLASGCRYKGIIIHEMGHAIGFQHEQTRADRDGYVYIATNNIQRGLEYNFMRYGQTDVSSYNVPYDYTSVMHYSQYAFSANGQPTIQARDRRFQEEMGNREGLSYSDIALANKMYGCAEQNSCEAKECPGGFQGPDCECWCNSGDRSSPVKKCDGSVVTENPSAVTTTTTEAPMNCEDNHQYCPDWAAAGYCSGEYRAYMSTNCRLSCNKCQDPVTTTTTTTMATPPIENCVDENSYCHNWANWGECSRNPSYMMAYCKRSCGVCQGMTTTTSCRDANSYCPYWTDYCTNDVYRDYLRDNCAASCGYCRAQDEAVTSTAATPTQDPSCMDRSGSDVCSRKAHLCSISASVRSRCSKTCGMC